MNTNPYQPPAGGTSDFPTPRVRVSEGKFFLAWFLFFVAASVGGACAGGVAGAVVGGVIGAQGGDLQQVQLMAVIVGYVLSVPINYVCFRFIGGPMLLRP